MAYICKTKNADSSSAPALMPCPDLSKFEGAIFDVDGTLLDSMFKWEEVESGYIISLGITPKPDIRDSLRVLSQHEVANHFKIQYGIDKDMQTITDEKNKMIEPFYFAEVKLRPGVAELLELLKSHGIKMCVATATDRYLVDTAMERLGISKYFSKTFSCCDYETTKSKPDIFIKSAEFLGTPVDKTLVFEDAPHAITSAKDAGFTIVAVYDETMANQQEQIKEIADYHCDCWSDFLRLYSN